jgi:hypothetical protein
MKIKTQTRPMRASQQLDLATGEQKRTSSASLRTPKDGPWQNQPLPDVSDFRPESAALGDGPRLSPLQVQLGQGASTDGAAFLAAKLDWIREKSAANEAVMVVFDLDNTLFDTRARTLHAAKSFDERNGSQWFAKLKLEDVQLDGEKTARQVREPSIPEDVIAAFSAFWGESFWTPENLRHDHEMPDTLLWAKAAQEAGADVRYLMGRTAPFHDVSLEQLRRAGLRVEESQLCCKPDVDVATAPFKSEILNRWSDEAPIAWFLTEGLRDLAHVQETMPTLATVMLDCSFEDASAHRISKDTPRLPACF